MVDHRSWSKARVGHEAELSIHDFFCNWTLIVDRGKLGLMKAKLAAAGTVLLWASAFPAIAVADRGLGPAGLAVARLVIASAALAAIAPFLGVRRPRWADLP